MVRSRVEALALVVSIERDDGPGYEPGGDAARLLISALGSRSWAVELELRPPAAAAYRVRRYVKAPREISGRSVWPPTVGTWIPVLVSDGRPQDVEIDWARLGEGDRLPPPRLLTELPRPLPPPTG